MPGERLLVADDDRTVREMMQALLQAEGYRVEIVPDGAAALARLSEGTFDLVLTDLRMPVLDGLGLLKESRRRFPSVGVVVFSGAGEDDFVVRCLQEGALDYLRKPFTRRQLLVIVRDALARRGASPGLAARYEMSGWLELTAESAMETVERFRICVDRLLARRISPEAAEELRYAIDELGRNAVEWGNAGRAGKRVHFSYCLLDDKVMFKIEDEGDGFNPGRVPDPATEPQASLAAREAEGKRAGGFGIHLVRRLMDEVLYSEKGNVVIMSKRLGPPAEGTA